MSSGGFPEDRERLPVTLPRPPITAPDTNVLVRLARGGDRRAFDSLVRRYRQKIKALALHLTGRESDAEDVTQEVFLLAYRKLDQFEGRSEFYTWLYRIAVHRAIALRRHRGKRTVVDVDDPRIELALEVDAAGDPQKALLLRESYARLLSAFDLLSPTLRTTVALVALQGMSHKDAARVLDTNEGTVAWRMHEARKQLRARMEAPRHRAAKLEHGPLSLDSLEALMGRLVALEPT